MTDIYVKTHVILCLNVCFDIPNSFRLGHAIGHSTNLEEGLSLLGHYLIG